MKIRAIITGATGMVGEGVLHECLKHPEVESVLVITRKSTGVSHPKLTEIIHSNFHDLSTIEDKLKNLNACFFCLGVSSVGLTEAEYNKLTYELTIHVAETLLKHNPDMTFGFISGSGTDSTEKGKVMWARIKGKAENHILRMPFKNAYCFRPGYMQPIKGLKRANKAYAFISWMYPALRPLFPKFVSTLEEMALAMINSVLKGYEKRILEVMDIVELAKR